MVKKKGKRKEKTTTTLSEKCLVSRHLSQDTCLKTLASTLASSNVSEQRDKGWIHVIRVHDTTHLAVTTTRQGNRCS